MRRSPFLVISLVIALSSGALIYASDGYTASQGVPASITGPDSVCKKVTNGSSTGLSEYIPTASIAEWRSFYGSPPSGVTLASCADTLTTKSAALQRYEHACAGDPATQKIYCFDGLASDSGLTLAYSPSNDTVTIKSTTAPSSRYHFSCAYSGATAKIYCFGGEVTSPSVSRTNQVLEYNPATNTVTTKSAVLPNAVRGLSCATDSTTGKIYCFGGVDGSTYYNKVSQYDPTTDVMTVKSAVLPSARASLSCAQGGDAVIYCLGGESGSSPTSQIVGYNPATNVMSVKAAALSPAVQYHSCVGHANGNIYCFGGNTGSGWTSAIQKYNPTTDTRTTLSLAHPSGGTLGIACAVSPADGSIYCFGGATSIFPSAYAATIQFNPGS